MLDQRKAIKPKKTAADDLPRELDDLEFDNDINLSFSPHLIPFTPYISTSK